MNQLNIEELWQIEVGGQVYEANLIEMSDWIAGGSLQPDDKVRKGNLRWIEARKVPALIQFFNAKAKGTPMPVLINASAFRDPGTISIEADPATSENVPANKFENFQLSVSHYDPNFCSIHIGDGSFYVCKECSAPFCKVCPKSFGGSVRICPACGGLCSEIPETQAKAAAENAFRQAMTAGFGFRDFVEAGKHPFKFKTGLLLGGLMFTFFTLGQSASAIGGIVMIVGAIFCVMLANMLTFGVLAHTLENFAQGKISSSFMPDFDDFSIWDDVLHPFFLSIGVYISSFGAFMLILLVGLFFAFSALNQQAEAHRQELERLPGTPYFDTTRTVQQSENVRDLLGKTASEQAGRVQGLERIGSEDLASPPAGDTEASVMRAQEMIDRSQKERLEGTFGKTPETRQQEYDEIVAKLIGLAPPLVVLGGIALLWGLFFFPAACIVAGYTRSFFAAINPLVGLDTIKRLGAVYLKILVMGLVLLITSVIVGGVLRLILSSFDMPGVGNLPATAIAAWFTFYLWVVYSVILGFALYKGAGRLQLVR